MHVARDTNVRYYVVSMSKDLVELSIPCHKEAMVQAGLLQRARVVTS